MTIEKTRPAFTPTDRPSQAFVAVLDVLGFKNRLKRTPLTQLVSDYRQLLRLAAYCSSLPVGSARGLEKWTVGRAIFSDSVLLCCDDGWEELRTLISCVADLEARALESGWPFRGAIAYGECVLDLAGGVFVGQPIVDAFLAAESQEWIGVGLHATVIQHPLLGSRIKGVEDVVEYPVPAKRCVTPMSHAVQWGPTTTGAVSALKSLSATADSCRSRRKYAATVRFLKKTCQGMHALS
jgi:hypothetical protein